MKSDKLDADIRLFGSFYKHFYKITFSLQFVVTFFRSI